MAAQKTVDNHCYCGATAMEGRLDIFLCEKCKKYFHTECLRSGNPSVLKGDTLFHFKCENCSGDEEEFNRMRLQWFVPDVINKWRFVQFPSNKRGLDGFCNPRSVVEATAKVELLIGVVHLTLYNLQLSGGGMCGYYRWKEHICKFIDKHWSTLFGSYRKKTSLWHGTVAGVLSSGCPHIFSSGASELHETGWWRLTETKPPCGVKQGIQTPKTGTKRKESPTLPQDTPKEGLRSRRGKTSLQVAMELKAKRSTLLEAKDMRKSLSTSKIQSSEASASSKTSSLIGSVGSLSSHKTSHVTTSSANPSPVTEGHLTTTLITTTPTLAQILQGSSAGTVGLNYRNLIKVNSSSLGKKTPTTSANINQGLGHDVKRIIPKSAISQNIVKLNIKDSATSKIGAVPMTKVVHMVRMKTEPTLTATPKSTYTEPSFVAPLPSKTERTSVATPNSTTYTEPLFVTPLPSKTETSLCLKTEPLSDAPAPSKPSSVASLQPAAASGLDKMDQSADMDDDGYLRGQDMKIPDTVPNLLMSDDMFQESDSDLEIDPGSVSPPPVGSPVEMEHFPPIQELISNLTTTQTQVQNEAGIHGDNEVSMMETNQEDEESVVDSESESDSGLSETSDESGVIIGKESPKRPSRKVDKTEMRELTVPEVKYHPITSYEERNLLRELETAAKCGPLPANLNRLKRKLIVRQQKREHGLPVFDIDAEMNRLAQQQMGEDWSTQYGNHGNLPVSRFMGGDVRILDKFQTGGYNIKSHVGRQPSFLNRLVGSEEDQLQCVVSPYTARMLKPFIRRDYESRPLKMQLLQEIKAYSHRKDKTWTASPPPPLDYCYVRPQHIASVNALCREFFWPGIDLSESLQYPDFSCVVLFRKIVIGFAFMVPDVKYNEAYISFIFTHPEWRRAGMATFMLYHLIQTCMGKDVTLHVSATNPAMLLYQKFGFKTEELDLDFYDKYYPADCRDCKHAFFLRLRR